MCSKVTFTFIKQQKTFRYTTGWSHVHWPLTRHVPGVNVCAEVQQQLHHRCAVFLSSCMEGRIQGFAFLYIST